MKYNGKEYYSQGDIYNAIEEENNFLRESIKNLNYINKQCCNHIDELEKNINDIEKIKKLLMMFIMMRARSKGQSDDKVIKEMKEILGD